MHPHTRGNSSCPWRSAAIAAFAASMLAVAAACGGGESTGGESPPVVAESGTPGAKVSVSTPTVVATPTYVPPPILANRTATVSGASGGVIPEGFLRLEEKIGTPLGQPGVHYVRDDGPDLPPLLAPCGTPVSMQSSSAIDARQVVLVSPMLWKLGRLTVYRDGDSAKRVFADHRDALARCGRHEDGQGRNMVWETRAIDIGDEAIFIGGQQYADQAPINVHYRGVFMRQGRAVYFLLDLGRSTVPPAIHEVEGHRKMAVEMAQALRAASWAQ